MDNACVYILNYKYEYLMEILSFNINKKYFCEIFKWKLRFII